MKPTRRNLLKLALLAPIVAMVPKALRPKPVDGGAIWLDLETGKTSILTSSSKWREQIVYLDPGSSAFTDILAKSRMAKRAMKVKLSADLWEVAQDG